MDELVNNCLLIFEEESSESENNPWNVRDVSEFLKYCCPECHEQSYNLESFANHAIENHPKGKTFFCDNYAKEYSSLENHESMVENLENTMSEMQESKDCFSNKGNESSNKAERAEKRVKEWDYNQ